MSIIKTLQDYLMEFNGMEMILTDLTPNAPSSYALLAAAWRQRIFSETLPTRTATFFGLGSIAVTRQTGGTIMTFWIPSATGWRSVTEMRFFPHCPIHTGYLRLASAM